MRYVALVVSTVLLAGCASQSTHGARPTEVETREAYLGTPVIVAEQGQQVSLGSTRTAIERKLGKAAITYLRPVHGTYRPCIIYPINGTQVWDRHGSPQADEWEMCFTKNRLASKRRLRAPGNRS
jgi:hypothetical protein